MTNSEQQFLFKFMGVIFEKMSAVMAVNFALQQILIKSGIIESSELVKAIEESKKHPERVENIQTLKQMIDNFNTTIKEGV